MPKYVLTREFIGGEEDDNNVITIVAVSEDRGVLWDMIPGDSFMVLGPGGQLIDTDEDDDFFYPNPVEVYCIRSFASRSGLSDGDRPLLVCRTEDLEANGFSVIAH